MNRHAHILNACAARRHRSGFALIDVIVGGVLLAIGLGAVISLTTRSLTVQTDSEKMITASWLADELLSTVVVEGPVDFPKLFDTSSRFDYPFEEFDYDVIIDDQGIGQPFRVTAVVRWAGGRGERFVQVQTLISERGGDPEQPRAPVEPVDRMARWYPEEKE